MQSQLISRHCSDRRNRLWQKKNNASPSISNEEAFFRQSLRCFCFYLVGTGVPVGTAVLAVMNFAAA